MGDNTLMGREFFNLYRHNFVRVAIAIPEVRVADPAFNGRQIIALLGEATKLEPVRAAAGFDFVAVVALPGRVDGLLYNCAAVLHRGRVLGVVPKTYPPDYREFYELRHFAPASYAGAREIDLAGQSGVPFSARLLFEAEDQPGFVLAAEICEDLWTPIPPSSYAALAGATVLVNLSASNITTGKDEYRSQLVANQSGRCLAAYVYCAAGYGESTPDLAC